MVALSCRTDGDQVRGQRRRCPLGGRHPTSMTANIYQWQRQHIRRGTTSRRVWWRNYSKLTANTYQRRRQRIRRGTTSRRIWWRTASRNDDGQHIPTATAAHTTRYDLQADMVRQTQSGRQYIRVSYRTDGADHGGRVCSMVRNQDGGVIINNRRLLLIIRTGQYGRAWRCQS